VRVVIALLLIARVAIAGEHDATFAKTFGVAESAVRDVVGYELPAGNDTTHVLIGRADQMTGAVFRTCDATQCADRRVEFGVADAIELNGIVDLHGAPVPFPNRALPGGKVPGAERMKFPAIVIRARESTKDKKRRVKLYVISLVEADRASTVLQDTAEEIGANGRGVVRTYKLEALKDLPKDAPKPLDIVATERRKPQTCEPTEQRFTLEEHHYRTKSYTPGKGC
jgi:hypothetical protein